MYQSEYKDVKNLKTLFIKLICILKYIKVYTATQTVFLFFERKQTHTHIYIILYYIIASCINLLFCS